MQSCVYANEEFGTVTTCGVNRITVFVVIVASDNIAEQVAFPPTDPRTYKTNRLGTERISRAGMITVLLASIRSWRSGFIKLNNVVA